MKVETDFHLNMTALRAWSLLADLTGYAVWHPIYQFIDPVQEGGKTTLSWRIFDDRRIRIDAEVVRFDKPSIITWRCGLGRLMSLQETYELREIDRQVDIRHRVECSGAVGHWAGTLLRLDLYHRMKEQDAAFIAHAKRHRLDPSGHRQRRHAPLISRSGAMVDE
ncbi:MULTISPECIES: SRPBCC family protein [unclassified Novosphingobium]|jgi:hypothetical protein|uniref:SRPBCC family protein n=1 Tax=unclassified Novosphingobium TaxID=2644732 RepID=UPI00086933B5|nr:MULTISPECIES: SRPBCC family protein [unclassified Novosphingobium]MBN9145687.1 SRPBCC family protein [Novosphingobium sp.]ODU80709.1 MAG: hypothetical protein ABT10_15920 [Novosphingobium sp. SCN 63-17]OJX87859.1 MAG: hypothetical protein BGP00_00075 [Novosphingobium sp. 63-713]